MQFNSTEMCKIPYQTHFRNDKTGPNISDKINEFYYSRMTDMSPYVNCNKCASNTSNSGVSSSMCNSGKDIDRDAYNASVSNVIFTENILRRGGPLPEVSFTPDHLCAIVPSRPESCKAKPQQVQQQMCHSK